MRFVSKLSFVVFCLCLAAKAAYAAPQSFARQNSPSSNLADGSETTRDLLAHLTSRAEFSRAASMMQAGDTRAAAHTLAQYFRMRPAPVWPLGPQSLSQSSRAVAEDARGLGAPASRKGRITGGQQKSNGAFQSLTRKLPATIDRSGESGGLLFPLRSPYTRESFENLNSSACPGAGACQSPASSGQ